MSKKSAIAYINKDLRKLERDIAKYPKPLRNGYAAPQLLTYLISRKHTLLEIQKILNQ